MPTTQRGARPSVWVRSAQILNFQAQVQSQYYENDFLSQLCNILHSSTLTNVISPLWEIDDAQQTRLIMLPLTSS